MTIGFIKSIDMLQKEARQIVERIKTANNIRIIVDNDISLSWVKNIHNTKKLFHDIGIAIQDYYVKLKI